MPPIVSTPANLDQQRRSSFVKQTPAGDAQNRWPAFRWLLRERGLGGCGDRLWSGIRLACYSGSRSGLGRTLACHVHRRGIPLQIVEKLLHRVFDLPLMEFVQHAPPKVCLGHQQSLERDFVKIIHKRVVFQVSLSLVCDL